MPMIVAIDPFWSDFFTAGGFAVGMLGLLVSILGFWYTILQVRKTKAAAVAAQEAARESLIESRHSFRRFIAAAASRLLVEARGFVETEMWHLASVRVDDLAHHAAQLSEAQSAATSLVAQLRGFARKFAAKARNGVKTSYYRSKWEQAIQQLQEILDRVLSPFPHELRERHDSQTENERDRGTPLGENPS